MILHVSVILFTGGGSGIPVCIAGGIPAGLAAGLQGVVSQHALQGSRPTPRGEVEGSVLRGSPGPHPGGSPGLHLVGIPACTEADTPPPHTHMATAVGSTHPARMHSCFCLIRQEL